MQGLFKPSRLVAYALVIGALLYIFSGSLFGNGDHGAETAAAETAAVDEIIVQKVGVLPVKPEAHSRTVILSCVTRADRRASAVARGAGVIVELSVSRGDRVKSGDVIAIISDEGRTSALAQAQALLDQVLVDYEAKKRLIERGDQPRNSLPALEAQVAGARAQLAQAQAELDRANVKAPIDGIIDTVPFQVGQAVNVGSEIAIVIDPDPMLAVGQVSEARRGTLEPGQAVDVRFIDSSTAKGTISFVGLSAEKATRTYPVEAKMNNADARIGDGVTCEMTVKLAPVDATAVPRSALIFSDIGELGLRVVIDGKAHFQPVEIVEDGREMVWVSGFKGPTDVIVVGQDFVKEGDKVEARPASDALGTSATASEGSPA